MYFESGVIDYCGYKKAAMKFISTILILSVFCSNVQAQLSKGNWLLGGTANLSATRNSYSGTISTSATDALNIMVLPDIGYFLADKLSVGLRPGYTKFKAEGVGPTGLSTNANRLDFGPFIRYYFLNTDKPFNVLADVGYQYGLYWFRPSRGSRHSFSASTGMVAFFNSSVALEMLVGYYSQSEKIRIPENALIEYRGLQMSIGFLFHLER